MSVSSNPRLWTCNVLRDYCVRNKLKRSGKKAALLDRVIAHQSTSAISTPGCDSSPRPEPAVTAESSAVAASPHQATSSVMHVSSTGVDDQQAPTLVWKNL
ncbi:uncharacterized protein LOC135808740 [Sycon ciliatum]|uniref:uncharacterized protein LOC135808740 n=1 Tax=Sycon ciliatum TaxID=27933 RepID=UPI0031F6E620